MGKGKRLRRANKAPARAVTYWHGGSTGRSVGDELIPGAEVARRTGVGHLINKEDFQDYRPDFVYITTDRDLAIDFGILQGHVLPAALYRVAPIGAVQHDPDFPRGVSFRCLRAEVLEVEMGGLDESTPLTNASYHYQTWDDGEDLYDTNGYARPSKAARHLGVTEGDLYRLGRYPDFPYINARCSEIVAARNPGLTHADVLRVRRATGGNV